MRRFASPVGPAKCRSKGRFKEETLGRRTPGRGGDGPADQGVPRFLDAAQSQSARPGRVSGLPRGDFRAARAERLGEVHAPENPARPALPDAGARRDLRARPAQSRDQGPDRLHAGGVLPVPVSERGGDARLLRAALQSPVGRAPSPRGAAPGDGRAHPPAAAPDRRILQGHGAPHRPGAGLDQRPGPALPRRADHRAGSDRHARDQGPHPGAPAAGKDRAAVQPPARRR